MAKILSLETTTTNCSVSIAEGEKLLAIKEDKTDGYSHAEKLHVFINEALQEAGLSLKDLDAIAVSKGPGSYTGLRIGVSAAKGLCFSLNIPLISIPTLQVLAKQALQKNRKIEYIIPMLDARRMEVFTAVYNSSLEEMEATNAKVLTEDSFKNYLEKGTVVFIGNGVNKFEEICNHTNAIFVDTLPSSKEMLTLAATKQKISDVEDVAYFEPYYLKDFVITQKK